MPARPARRKPAPDPGPVAAPDAAATGWFRVRATLQRHGLLPMAGGDLPGVAALVARTPVAGSWWSHPDGRAIYAVSARLACDPRLLLVKLLDGKDTWVHPRLAPALLSVARAGEGWQVAGLSPAARALRARLARAGELPASGAAARELQQRLLCVGLQVHTATGRHQTRLRTWERWAEGRGLSEPLPAAAAGRRQLEFAARSLGGEAAVALLPWRPQPAAPASQPPSRTPRAGRRAARR
jgi:hypothetical protein